MGYNGVGIECLPGSALSPHESSLLLGSTAGVVSERFIELLLRVSSWKARLVKSHTNSEHLDES